MLNPTDMSTPVTRGELREEIAQLEARLDQKLDHLETRLDQKLDHLETRLKQTFATKADLEIWGGALLERLSTELARHTGASQEAMSTQISIVDEQYADLPARVTRLEATVFPPNRR
jgi:DNA anti-recombination protein RmuC